MHLPPQQSWAESGGRQKDIFGHATEKTDLSKIGPKAQKCQSGTKLGRTNPDLMAFEVRKEENMFGRITSPAVLQVEARSRSRLT